MFVVIVLYFVISFVLEVVVNVLVLLDIVVVEMVFNIVGNVVIFIGGIVLVGYWLLFVCCVYWDVVVG